MSLRARVGWQRRAQPIGGVGEGGVRSTVAEHLKHRVRWRTGTAGVGAMALWELSILTWVPA